MQQPKPEYFTGLDLGQAQDYTAVAVLQKTIEVVYNEPKPPTYAVRHLERFAIGTSYGDIREKIVRLFDTEPLSNSRLMIDGTGIGRPALRFFREATIQAQIKALTITNADLGKANIGVGISVPKQDLVAVLQLLLQARRLKVAPTLPEAETLINEFSNFKTKKPTASGESLDFWREAPHDDLVLAVAIAAWEGERQISKTKERPFAVPRRRWGPW